jgi:kynurenine 3-monooxygenase
MKALSRVPETRRLSIVGGGLVGSLLAIYLSRRGHDVDVFDRQPDPRGGSAGSRPSVNLTLCTRGLRALAAVGLEQQALARAVPARGRRIHGLDGTVTFQPYGNCGEAIHSISRAELHLMLVRAAFDTPGVTYHFDQKCVKIDATRGDAVFQHTRSGKATKIESAKIFGTDGAYSAVRMQLQKTARFDYSQQYASQGYKELAIPAPADGGWPFEPDALHIWPRGSFMLIGFPNLNRSFSFMLYGPFAGERSFETLTDERGLLAFMRHNFPDVADRIPSVAQQFFERPANTMLTTRCRPWSRQGNVVLLGDAAHAILPWYGQGANAGFEDVACLDRCLGRYGEDWEAAFSEFELLRRPNMDIMADLCAEHLQELNEHVQDPRFHLRKKVERRLQQLYPHRFSPLYSTVAFTCTPYAEALRLDREQRAVVDRVITLDGIERFAHGPELDRLLEQCLQEVA